MTVNGDSQNAPRATSSRRIGMIAIAVAVGALAGVAGVYGIGSLTRNAGDAACQPSFDLARKIAPFAKGEVAAVTPAAKPLLLPDLAFQDAACAQKKLSDWRGRTVLLNLWATWCVPCRKEMPALDELQAKLGSADFEVISINIDTRDVEKPKTWLKEVGINKLGYYADNSAKVFQDLKAAGKAFGMPTTLLVDRNGCELATLAGPAEWASDDAIKLVTAALGK
jgi:thiol-disulfide isomerase/thioredoxin